MVYGGQSWQAAASTRGRPAGGRRQRSGRHGGGRRARLSHSPGLLECAVYDTAVWVGDIEATRASLMTSTLEHATAEPRTQPYNAVKAAGVAALPPSSTRREGPPPSSGLPGRPDINWNTASQLHAAAWLNPLPEQARPGCSYAHRPLSPAPGSSGRCGEQASPAALWLYDDMDVLGRSDAAAATYPDVHTNVGPAARPASPSPSRSAHHPAIQ